MDDGRVWVVWADVQYEVPGDAVIGRWKKADLVLDQEAVHRRHAELIPGEEGGILLRSLQRERISVLQPDGTLQTGFEIKVTLGQRWLVAPLVEVEVVGLEAPQATTSKRTRRKGLQWELSGLQWELSPERIVVYGHNRQMEVTHVKEREILRALLTAPDHTADAHALVQQHWKVDPSLRYTDTKAYFNDLNVCLSKLRTRLKPCVDGIDHRLRKDGDRVRLEWFARDEVL